MYQILSTRQLPGVSDDFCLLRRTQCRRRPPWTALFMWFKVSTGSCTTGSCQMLSPPVAQVLLLRWLSIYFRVLPKSILCFMHTLRIRTHRPSLMVPMYYINTLPDLSDFILCSQNFLSFYNHGICLAISSGIKTTSE